MRPASMHSLIRDLPGLVAAETDASSAEALLNGTLILSGATSTVVKDLRWSAIDRLGPAAVAEVHTMQWLDVLRRQAESVGPEACARLWSELVGSWWTVFQQPRSGGPWYASAVIKRGRVLALGAHLAGAAPWMQAILQAHRDSTYSWLMSKSPHGRHDELFLTLWALLRAIGARPVELASSATDWVRQVVDESGWIAAADLVAMEDRRSRVLTVLDALEAEGVDVHTAKEWAANRSFAPHLVTPSGAYLDRGSVKAPADAFLDDPAVCYSRTHGEDGDPPTELIHVSPQGLASWRSGFGEFERTCDIETQATALFGPTPNAPCHADGGRITYSSDGIDWLIDPLASTLCEAEHHSTATLAGLRPAATAAWALARHSRGDQTHLIALETSQYRPLQSSARYAGQTRVSI